MTPLVITRFG